MAHTRREALKLGLISAGGLALPATADAQPSGSPPATEGCAAPTPRWQAGVENQRRADLGDGRYLNPILAGDRPDPNILKDGEDYYATFSSFQYYPGVPIWHSRDLVNWTPLTAAPCAAISAASGRSTSPGMAIAISSTFPRSIRPMPSAALKTWVIHAAKHGGSVERADRPAASTS